MRKLESNDMEQLEWLRRWNEKKRQKSERKRKKHTMFWPFLRSKRRNIGDDYTGE